MLTYSQLQTIAAILGWSVEDVETSLAELNAGFMNPDVQEFLEGELETDDGEPNAAGVYCRLSAPGYLDCTEWSGPFDTEEDAVADLLRTYGD